jgi:hypothetical protein
MKKIAVVKSRKELCEKGISTQREEDASKNDDRGSFDVSIGRKSAFALCG